MARNGINNKRTFVIIVLTILIIAVIIILQPRINESIQQSQISATSTASALAQTILNPYIEKAQELLSDYGLEGTITVDFISQNLNEKFYALTINVPKISNLSNTEIKRMLWSLDKVEIGENYVVSLNIISGDDEYQYENQDLYINRVAWNPQYTSSSIVSNPSTSTTVLGVWNDTWGGINRKITISKIGEDYQLKEVYSDGSHQTITLGVKIVGDETRLYEIINAYGDYMVIKANGNLAFYDDQGFIFEIKPEP